MSFHHKCWQVAAVAVIFLSLFDQFAGGVNTQAIGEVSFSFIWFPEAAYQLFTVDGDGINEWPNFSGLCLETSRSGTVTHVRRALYTTSRNPITYHVVLVRRLCWYKHAVNGQGMPAKVVTWSGVWLWIYEVYTMQTWDWDPAYSLQSKITKLRRVAPFMFLHRFWMFAVAFVHSVSHYIAIAGGTARAAMCRLPWDW